MKPMRLLLPFYFFICIPIASAQENTWTSCFWGDSVVASTITVSTSGAIYMGGTSVGKIGCNQLPVEDCVLADLGTDVQAAYVVRMNTSGSVEASYVFSPANGERTEMLGVVKSADDGLWTVHRSYVTGSSQSLFLTRLTADLTVVAQTLLSTDTTTTFCKMAGDSEGNVYVACLTEAFNTIQINKHDASGNLVWSKSGSGTIHRLLNLQITPAGKLMVYASVLMNLNYDGVIVGSPYSNIVLLLNPADGSLDQGFDLHKFAGLGTPDLGSSFIATEDGKYCLTLVYTGVDVELLGHTIEDPPSVGLALNTIVAELNSDFSLSNFTMFHSTSDYVQMVITDVVKDKSGGYYLGGNMEAIGDVFQNGAVILPEDWNTWSYSFVMRLDADMDFVWYRWMRSRGPNPSTGWDLVRDLELMPDNSLLVHGSMGKGTIIYPPDTTEAYQSNLFTMRFADANRAIGRIWVDVDDNGMYDSTDVPVPFRAVTDANNQVLGFSNNQGKYNIAFPGSTAETISVSHPAGLISVHPVQYDLDFGTAATSLKDSLDFRLVAESSFTDVAFYVTEKTRPRPGVYPQWQCVVSNEGTTTQNVSASVIIPGLVDYVSSDPPATVSGDTLSWAINDLAGFHKKNILIRGFVDFLTPIGTLLTLNGQVSVPSNDIDSTNNRFVLEQTVSAPHDPNDKQSIPSGQIAADLTPELLDIPIDYLIRFQNTGTDTAFRVVVLDTLPALVDPATLRVIDHSHPMRIDLRGPNIVAFEFDKILLPDSTTNEVESHGFVRFEIEPIQPLVPGDVVRNRAAIYFDFNEPIITNRAIIEVVLSVGTYTPVDGLEFTVFPNPASNRLSVSAASGLPTGGRAVLFDIQQRQLLSQTTTPEQTMEMDLSGIPTGVCVLVLYDAQGKVLGAKKVGKIE